MNDYVNRFSFALNDREDEVSIVFAQEAPPRAHPCSKTQQTPALSGVCYIFTRPIEQMFLFRKFSEP